ncbi:MAG: IgA Peptidase M64 [Acidobacteriota bacterium]|nr:IgA Peptidase M64 [Acidobacteriota bacterium]
MRLQIQVPLLLLFAAAASAVASGSDFDAEFTGRTLRWDYYHSGTAGEEHVSLDRFRLEGEWPGRRGGLGETLGFGKYRFVVRDDESGEILFASGFSSIYGEWETTGEARGGAWRTFHESQRFPEPRRPVAVALEKRGDDGAFVEIHREAVDPASRFVDRSPVPRRGRAWAVVENGPPAEKVDLLVLGDGYTAAEMAGYEADVRRVVDALFAFPPFADRKEDFNVWAVDVAAESSGVTRPRGGFWNATALGLAYNAFDSERYMLTFANRELREIAALAPYDALILIANSDKYGGGGIYNLYSTAAARSAQLPYLIVHEFGHAFAGLGDEYYTSQVAYEDFVAAGREPSEPNVTALADPARLKWAALATPGVPLPTPWSQAEYDEVSLAFQKVRAELRASGASEARMDEYFAEVAATTDPMLRAEPYYGQVGAFEGASYQAKGLYRPAVDCIMFSRNPDHYCPVCAAAIGRAIDLHLGASRGAD